MTQLNLKLLPIKSGQFLFDDQKNKLPCSPFKGARLYHNLLIDLNIDMQRLRSERLTTTLEKAENLEKRKELRNRIEALNKDFSKLIQAPFEQ